MGIGTIIGSFFVFILLVWAGIFLFYAYYIDYQYESQIGSYFNNAIDMNTPDKMLEQIELGRQAILDSGLTEDDYGAYWFKKPDNSMKFQFDHIDSIIERIQAVQDWKDKSYGENSTSTESMNDVYEQKMTNLRKFIGEDLNGHASRSDWIARKAWSAKFHPIMYFGWIQVLLWVLLLAITIAFFSMEDYY